MFGSTHRFPSDEPYALVWLLSPLLVAGRASNRWYFPSLSPPSPFAHPFFLSPTGMPKSSRNTGAIRMLEGGCAVPAAAAQA